MYFWFNVSCPFYEHVYLCGFDLTIWQVGFSGGQIGDEDDHYTLIWWWESDYVFGAEKQTLQGKWKACLDSKIKYCTCAMLYIQC